MVRDRGLRSPTHLPAAARRAGRRSWRRTRSGPCPRRRRPAAGRRSTRPVPGEVSGTHRRDLRRPKGPDVNPSWPKQYSTCMINSPIRFMAMSSSACTGSPLRCLSEASIPPIAFSRHCSSRKISVRPTGATEVHRLVTQKPQNDLTLARHRPSLAKSQRACPAKPGLGSKTWSAKLARIYHRPINSNFLLASLPVIAPVVLGHFD